MNRRAFLSSTLLPVIAGLVPRTTFAAQGALVVRTVVVDITLSAGMAFAQAGRAAGLSVVGTGSDMTGYWTRMRARNWSAGEVPDAVAGFTGPEALFVLERLAWDRNLRVAFRAEHRANADGLIEHSLDGPAALVEALAERLPRAGADFPICMARLLADYPADAGRRNILVVRTRTQAVGLDRPVHSCVFAAPSLRLPPYSRGLAA